MAPKSNKEPVKEKEKESKTHSRKEAKGPKEKGTKDKAAKGKPSIEAILESQLPAGPVEPAVDLEELEEAEEERAAAKQSSSDAALAAATGPAGEMSASFKNFRHHPDMENFYRFIFENDLRHEALAIIDNMLTEKRAQRQTKVAKH